MYVCNKKRLNESAQNDMLTLRGICTVRYWAGNGEMGAYEAPPENTHRRCGSDLVNCSI